MSSISFNSLLRDQNFGNISSFVGEAWSFQFSLARSELVALNPHGIHTHTFNSLLRDQKKCGGWVCGECIIVFQFSLARSVQVSEDDGVKRG